MLFLFIVPERDFSRKMSDISKGKLLSLPDVFCHSSAGLVYVHVQGIFYDIYIFLFLQLYFLVCIGWLLQKQGTIFLSKYAVPCQQEYPVYKSLFLQGTSCLKTFVYCHIRIIS